MNKTLIKEFFLIIGCKLIKILLFLKCYYLISLILRIFIFKNKKISANDKNRKNIIVLTKTSGLQDLLYAFKSQNISNIVIYELPRILIKEIFYFFLRDKVIDYNYHINDKNLDTLKKKYEKTLTKIFFHLKKFLTIDLIIGFNAFYMAEIELRKAAKNNSIHFLVLHKENIYSPIENLFLKFMYSNLNHCFDGKKLLVYSENEKNLFLEAKLVKKKDIEVVGIPRTDSSINLRKTKPKKIILYFMIEENRGFPQHLINLIKRTDKLTKKLSKNFENKPSYKYMWKKMTILTENFLFNYAKKNPRTQIIFKGKIGVHENKFKNFKMPSNIKFIKTGTGHKYLKDAKTVIAFNTTAALEALAAGRHLVIPYFGFNKKELGEKFIIQLNKKYYANSLKDLEKKINNNLKTNFKSQKINNIDKKFLKFYIGNYNMDSSRRLVNCIREVLKS